MATVIISLSFHHGFVASSDTAHLVSPPPKKLQLILSRGSDGAPEVTAD